MCAMPCTCLSWITCLSVFLFAPILQGTWDLCARVTLPWATGIKSKSPLLLHPSYTPVDFWSPRLLIIPLPTLFIVKIPSQSPSEGTSSIFLPARPLRSILFSGGREFESSLPVAGWTGTKIFIRFEKASQLYSAICYGLPYGEAQGLSKSCFQPVTIEDLTSSTSCNLNKFENKLSPSSSWRLLQSWAAPQGQPCWRLSQRKPAKPCLESWPWEIWDANKYFRSPLVGVICYMEQITNV